ncbi:Glycosyl transferase family 2 [uncultured archaeon]|nr:Glycosyl transferase family 2 [uncultured archaeon]
MPRVSFLISAKNERKNISKIISGVRSQILPVGFEKEIIICSNGSTDKTADYAKGFPGIKVLELPYPNKAQAMNLLARHATGTHFVFLDADITPDSRATLALLNALKDKKIILAGATQKIESKGNKLQKTISELHEAVGPYQGIQGGMFALRREDFQEMPSNLIHDDAYLTFKAGKEHIVQSSEAIFHHLPSKSLIELFRRNKRMGYGIKQLENMGFDYSELARRKRLSDFAKLPLKIKIKGFIPLIVIKAGRKIGEHSKKPTW